jgi:hypothetical protein
MKGPFFIFLMMVPAFFVIIFLILLAMQYKQLKSFVAPQPAQLPASEVTPESQARTKARLREFLAKPETGNTQDTLALDAADLNNLVQGNPSLAKLGLDYRLDVQDTLLVARNSMPVERLPAPMSTVAKLTRVKGWLNSEMKGYPKLEGGKIILEPVSAVMNGIKAPASVLSSKGNLDLRDWVSDKDAYDRAIAGIKAVVVRDGRLLLIRG